LWLALFSEEMEKELTEVIRKLLNFHDVSNENNISELKQLVENEIDYMKKLKGNDDETGLEWIN